ncbi:Hypothetical Protein FCC1311_025412 [Hondaea fermentalgiana]|uniref:Sugar fermentation stimulation protein C-terminal domain-containing protein n=1 Tax=Hondaea fermentalgiana TaxID=2315210 RepID=A0A2R5G5Q3_9STRA|nr:Hypothetical Protein FCC1311_025412 [Hondaea fermentalgiana]|eukprot:GBG26320.1 Hypothetical Protein FCC1311_025412 [Hondaea fermentalgiana]
MVSGRVLARPSKRVRTPYVADVQLLDGTDSVVQAHSPSLGCAGMVSPGRIVEMTEVAATSSTSSSSSAKKTPPRKTSHSVCLCHDAPRVGGLGGMQGPVVGALPALAENFVLKALEEGWFAEFAPGYTVTKQKTYGGSRVDFVLNYEGEGEKKEEKNKQDAAKSDVTQGATSPRKTLIEVKNVVCADYLPGENPISTGMEGELEPRLASCLQDTQTGALLRAAVFPHGGTRKPKIKVLSSRAIKHVHELTQLHLSRRLGEENLDSAMIFVVNRSDCERFRPAHESCPLFARVLYEASLAGVRLLAYTVDWDLASGCAYLGHRIPVEFSAETKATPLDRVWLDQVLVYEAGPKPDSLGTKSSDKKHKKKHKKRSRRHD